MASQLIEEQRRGAEIHKGHGVCRQHLVPLLKDLSLPEGILPLEDIEEFGHNRVTGFVWLIQRKKKNHMFEKIKQLVSFATEVTAFIEDRKLKKITGIKARELLIWLTVKQVGVDEQSTEKVVLLTATGLSKSFPKSAFEPEPCLQSIDMPQVFKSVGCLQ
ncbi:hypothetical protein ZIOFF_033037 [Zingiber officinale]|uniref:Uncharacterized protein n=1 Tax=Zingiber officinale TaxID=94328 RepID=A0A8J5GHQ6_ZINOF|nr:hypothetical protein ZIOFF_033037 [Zingiber officinale]